MIPVVRTLEKECANHRYFFIYWIFDFQEKKDRHETAMSKLLFTPKQIIQLQKNPNVQNISERSITYTDAFKSQFIDGYFAGKTPRQIFKKAGFDEDIIGIKRIEQTAFRWRKAYEKNGLTGKRKSESGRTLKRELREQKDPEAFIHSD